MQPFRGVHRPIPDRVLARIWGRVEVSAPDECWPCTYSKLTNESGDYRQMGWVEDGLRCGTVAHRVAWTAFYGPIPDGLTVDHLCRNPPCCNPLHLRLRTNDENASDNQWARKTHCIRGHEFTPENIYYRMAKKNGRLHRQCRACAVIRRRLRGVQPQSRASGPILVFAGRTRHGTYAGYTRGCRCDPCQDARSAYEREYRARKRLSV